MGFKNQRKSSAGAVAVPASAPSVTGFGNFLMRFKMKRRVDPMLQQEGVIAGIKNRC